MTSNSFARCRACSMRLAEPRRRRGGGSAAKARGRPPARRCAHASRTSSGSLIAQNVTPYANAAMLRAPSRQSARWSAAFSMARALRRATLMTLGAVRKHRDRRGGGARIDAAATTATHRRGRSLHGRGRADLPPDQAPTRRATARCRTRVWIDARNAPEEPPACTRRILGAIHDGKSSEPVVRAIPAAPLKPA